MKFSLILSIVIACILNVACGGGSSAPTIASTTTTTLSTQPTVLLKTDTVVGTGADALNGRTVTVNYTGWLYNSNASNLHGTQFDSGTFSFVLGVGQVIAGFDQGVLGMKVGGKRTLIIPGSLGYGASGNGAIPPNAGLVFDVELTKAI